jgi:hypothetical protein
MLAIRAAVVQRWPKLDVARRRLTALHAVQEVAGVVGVRAANSLGRIMSGTIS